MRLGADAGTARLALAAVVAACLAAGYVSLVYWVYRDASARGSDRAGDWAFVVAVFAPALVVYLLHRGRLGDPSRPETDRDRLARVLGASAFAAVLVGGIAAPPDPITQLYSAGATLAVAVVAGSLVVFHGNRRDVPS